MLKHDPLPELLTAREAAELLRTSVDTLAVWRSTGRHAIPFLKIGRSVRYRRADLLRWLEERARTATGGAGK